MSAVVRNMKYNYGMNKSIKTRSQHGAEDRMTHWTFEEEDEALKRIFEANKNK